MALILFLVSITASVIGAVAGFGGGVMIKPVLDAMGILPVSTISFLSSCTVLCMSFSNLIKNRNDGIRLNIRTSSALAFGSIFGGIIGKALFQFVREQFGNENILGLIQAILLLATTVMVLVYILRKNRIRSLQVESLPACAVIGAILGIISSFLGIGGGPVNVAMLFYFFSMNAKEAAKNSIFIIMFSQIASILMAVVGHTVPDFIVPNLVCMALGGVTGGITGSLISKRLSNELVEKLVMACLIFVICTNIYNVAKFAMRVL